jgi:hypothetical protein
MYILRIVVLALAAGALAGVISGAINGDIGRGVPTAVGTTIGAGIAFAWLFSRVTVELPGVPLGDAEARIAAGNLLRGFRRTQEAGRTVYTAGTSILASHVALEPHGSGIRLDGMRSVVGRLQKKLNAQTDRR